MSYWVMLWNWIQLHPDTFSLYVGIIILAIYIYYYVFSLIHPKVYLQKPGQWRIRRFVGYMASVPSILKPKSTATEDTARVFMYPSWLPWTYSKKTLMLLQRSDVASYTLGELTIQRKYKYWNKEHDAFIFSDSTPRSYILETSLMEVTINTKIRGIDDKCSQGARASPSIIRQNLTQHSIPLQPGDYVERDTRLPGEPVGADYQLDRLPVAGKEGIITPGEKEAQAESSEEFQRKQLEKQQQRRKRQEAQIPMGEYRNLLDRG
jgi:hypothetical protein